MTEIPGPSMRVLILNTPAEQPPWACLLQELGRQISGIEVREGWISPQIDEQTKVSDADCVIVFADPALEHIIAVDAVRSRLGPGAPCIMVHGEENLPIQCRIAPHEIMLVNASWVWNDPDWKTLIEQATALVAD